MVYDGTRTCFNYTLLLFYNLARFNVIQTDAKVKKISKNFIRNLFC
jgi:hypothetical protein